MIFELAHELQHLQRIEPEVSEQFAASYGFYRPAADPLENLNRVLLESVGGAGRF